MPFEFTTKRDTPKPGLSIGTVLGKKRVQGEIGLEIEVEGKKLLYHEKVPLPWVYHDDHSLRGEENAEYVLAHPILFKEVPQSLDTLYKALKKNKARLDDSNRTSVHVHLNCQDWHLNRLASFLGIYFILEEVLTEWCGEERVGNLFCLRAKDAEAIVGWIKKFIRKDGQSQIPEILRYGNLNANSLHKYGSLEIRSLKGTDDPKVIETWVSVLERLYNVSADFDDPREVCSLVSGTGPLHFFETILGGLSSVVRQGVSWSDNEIAESIYSGVRLAQDICYCRDWELYKPMPLKADPFNRNLKTVAKKIMQNNEQMQTVMTLSDFNSYSSFAGSPLHVSSPNTVIPAVTEEEYLNENSDEWFEPDYDDDETSDVPY